MFLNFQKNMVRRNLHTRSIANFLYHFINHSNINISNDRNRFGTRNQLIIKYGKKIFRMPVRSVQ